MYFPDLLEEYKELLKSMRNEGITSGELFREVKQAIEWMETGYDPALVRSEKRTDCYTFDPYFMQTYIGFLGDKVYLPDTLEKGKGYMDDDEWEKEVQRCNNDKKRINEALSGLTDVEKAIFVAINAERISIRKVADMMGMSKSNAHQYYVKAKRKIRENIVYGAQLEMFE